MKTIRFTLSFLAAALASLVASAQQAPVAPFISSFVGDVKVTAKGSSAAAPAVIGQKLPEGTTIVTADGASVLIESHQGITTSLISRTSAVIGSHSVNVEGVRTAVIELKQGTTVSVLDPSKRAINNFSVRTPKGVAVAQGTTYTCTVMYLSGGEVLVTVNTLTGVVSFNVGERRIDVAEGMSANSNSTVASSIAAAIVAAPADEKLLLAEALKSTVSVVATLAEARKDSGDKNVDATLQTVLANTAAVAAEVAKSDKTLGDLINSNTQQAQVVDKTVEVITATASDDTQNPAAPPVITPSNPVDITIVSPSS
jgi:hypothetical protein